MDMIPEAQPVVQLFPKLELEDGQVIGVKIRQAGHDEVRLEVMLPIETGRFSCLRIDDAHGENRYRSVGKSIGRIRFPEAPMSACT